MTFRVWSKNNKWNGGQMAYRGQYPTRKRYAEFQRALRSVAEQREAVEQAKERLTGIQESKQEEEVLDRQ